MLIFFIVFCVMLENTCGERYKRTGIVYRETNYGTVEGFSTELTNVFFGIPYAKPPVGNLRWRHPQPLEPWEPNVLNATELPACCPQPKCEPNDTYINCPQKVSEDCLYLNIWTPLSAQRSSLFSVMLFIHGGHFQYTGTEYVVYDGAMLANRGQVIYVSINYRLGVLGYLKTDELGENNFGIADQSLAMKWVYENIHYFGGDRNRVTLFGQSAGAHSTVIHLTKPDTQYYFNNAILLSFPFPMPLRTGMEATYLAKVFAQEIGCEYNWDKPDMMDCLRLKSVQEIIDAQQKSGQKITTLRFLGLFQPWGPWVDSVVVPVNPLNAIETGNYFKKPIIIGSLTEEAIFYIYSAFRGPLSRRDYIATISLTLINPFSVFETLRTYSNPDTEDLREDLSEMATDFVFGCSARYASRLMVSLNIRVWLFTFDQPLSFRGGWAHDPQCEGRVCHAAELPFVFQMPSLTDFRFTRGEVVLSNLMIDYFSNFSKYSDPNGLADLRFISWPVYTQANEWGSLRFRAAGSHVVYHYRAHRCDSSDRIGYHSPLAKILDFIESGGSRIKITWALLLVWLQRL